MIWPLVQEQPASETAPIRLRRISRFGDHPEIVLDVLPATMGRGSSAEILVQDRWASRRHCEINQIDGVLTVRDLGSSHGTFVNVQQVSQSQLNPGDKLRIGISEFLTVM